MGTAADFSDRVHPVSVIGSAIRERKLVFASAAEL
jgi:hypothetical protein